MERRQRRIVDPQIVTLFAADAIDAAPQDICLSVPNAADADKFCHDSVF
jgi:hypothetical protein